jgi:hypothetical protein
MYALEQLKPSGYQKATPNKGATMLFANFFPAPSVRVLPVSYMALACSDDKWTAHG